MGASVNGMDEIIKNLHNQFTGPKFTRIENRSLVAGARVVGEAIEKELIPFKATGATVEEITIGKPTTRGGFKHILVGWSGPMERYRLVHLNEFGYTRNGKKYNPRAKGAIQRAINSSKQTFFDAVTGELSKHL